MKVNLVYSEGPGMYKWGLPRRSKRKFPVEEVAPCLPPSVIRSGLSKQSMSA
jgi:hypothetical protein